MKTEKTEVNMVDRIVSVLTYYTMGIFGLIWLVFSALTKRRISSFLAFNLYQSMFILAIISIFSLVYNIALNILSVVPFIGQMFIKLDIFLNQTPLYFTFTITGLIFTIFVTYLALLALLGKKPYVPYVSEIIKTNFGG